MFKVPKNLFIEKQSYRKFWSLCKNQKAPGNGSKMIENKGLRIKISSGFWNGVSLELQALTGESIIITMSPYRLTELMRDISFEKSEALGRYSLCFSRDDFSFYPDTSDSIITEGYFTSFLTKKTASFKPGNLYVSDSGEHLIYLGPLNTFKTTYGVNSGNYRTYYGYDTSFVYMTNYNIKVTETTDYDIFINLHGNGCCPGFGYSLDYPMISEIHKNLQTGKKITQKEFEILLERLNPMVALHQKTSTRLYDLGEYIESFNLDSLLTWNITRTVQFIKAGLFKTDNYQISTASIMKFGLLLYYYLKNTTTLPWTGSFGTPEIDEIIKNYADTQLKGGAIRTSYLEFFRNYL